ncbi:putative membrane protein [Rhodopseudomonas thermotolerans]|uniref:Membrane protein n=2 Tax=Rhodopseudomonas TaxID=1073 RepID=A0A336JL47_9BRAD|nr:MULTISPECIES: DUF2339 domain-containing protein [Rhodopseudomonas]RED37438.1 putative membrane protein [Rhodopseudomonas pentothenatexigens]REG03925.1 putative membrane protein [Rhodopseudomonas thermotolerans]SSW90405.1 uncharacterized membrane protein [Rhodopseudomonas pentothenatexigens]
MFELLAFALAVVALIIARKGQTQIAELRARLDALAVGPPLPASPEAATAPPTASKEAPLAPAAEPVPEIAATVTAEAPAAETTAAAAVEAAPEAAKPGFEERIGTRWVVWVGGLTLALGGFFMVRYSIEQGLLGPGVRVLLGGLFALALLIAGEATRRKESVAQLAALPIANIPAILTAAGTAVAFATVYAAYALYDFLVPATAFILLGLVALGTLAAALLHGPALAGLGVVAGFATPVLVSSGEPDYWALYIYLAVVTAASFGLARIRLWRWLAVTTVVLALLWTLPGLEGPQTLVAPHAFHVIAGFVLAALLVVCGLLFGPPIEPGRIEPVSSAALATYLLGAALIVIASWHADAAMAAFALLIAATLAIAWRAAAATAAVGAGAVLVALVFLSWVLRSDPALLVLPGGALPGIGADPLAGPVTTHLIAAAVFAIGFAGGGVLMQGRAVSASVPVIWAAAGVFTPLALLIALYARIAHLDRSIPFAILAVVLAAAFGLATERLGKRDNRPGLQISIALFATGTLGALALALTFALEKGWLTIALALMAAATAWISLQRPIPFLRWLAAILAGIVVARIGWEPRIVGDAVGTTPVFNWLLWGYGVPAASFWLASWWMRKRGDDVPLRMMESAAILFTVLLAFMEIRHAVNAGDVYRDSAGLTEVALQVCVTLAMAIGLERLRLRSRSPVHNVAAVLLAVFGGLGSVFGLLLWENPTFWATDVGGLVINSLLLGYALPAVLALLLSYAVAGMRRPAYGNGFAALALIMGLAYVTLQVQRVYHGPILAYGPTTDAEQYTYSVAWLICGVLLLGAGLLFNSQRARLASAVVIGLTIGKAFLIDMSTLTGVYRALSFMGLGVVLVTIGWLYQRILFRPPASRTSDATVDLNR